MDELIIHNEAGDTKFILKEGKEFAIVDGKEIPIDELYKKDNGPDGKTGGE